MISTTSSKFVLILRNSLFFFFRNYDPASAVPGGPGGVRSIKTAYYKFAKYCAIATVTACFDVENQFESRKLYYFFVHYVLMRSVLEIYNS